MVDGGGMDRDELAAVFYGTGAVPSPWATDCPVRFDVWLAFAQLGSDGLQRRVDLILAINEEHGVSRVLDHLRALNVMEANPIAAGSFVVARLTLAELVRAILPMTSLHSVVRLAQDLGPAGLGSALEHPDAAPQVHDLAESEERQQERNRQLMWFLRLLRTVVSASMPQPARRRRRQAGQPPSEPASKAPSSTEVVSSMISAAVVERNLTQLPVPTASRVIDRRRRFPVVSVTTNRPSSPAVTRSRSTIKADAAEQLFSVDCSSIGWAVLDSGIDAQHEAFGDWDTSGPNPVQLGSRVMRIFDFVIAREIPEGEVLDNGLIDWPRALPWLEMQLPPVPAPLVPPTPPPTRPPRLPYVPPVDAHGTHVAGILGGCWPGKEFRGICPTIRLYDFRVLGVDGHGDEFSIVTALQAIRYINEQAGRLAIAGVNLSLSVPHDVATHSCGSTPVCIECERLVRSGVVVVTAAGNAGYSGVIRTLGADYRTVSISDPGNAELAITVGSTHRSDPHRHGVSYFSSRGPTADGRPKPDLLAPGEDIDGPIPGGGIAAMQGTSQAAAHVSGAAAMLIARYRELLGRPERVKEILNSTATNLSRERDFQGNGLVDVLRAMQSL
jgi:Subtilase family